MPDRATSSAEWISLAEKFPVSLSKDSAPEAIGDDESPDSYGIGIDKKNYLYAETSPSSGTAWTGIGTVSAPTYAPATCTWRYCFNRLFGYVTSAGSNTLYYGAYGYDSTYIIQDLGYVPVDYESSVITNVIPFGNNVAVFKSDHVYIIPNADNPGNSFVAEFLKQASGLPVAADVIVMDNTLIWANTHGVFAYDGQNIRELTYPIRSSLAPFNSGTVTSLKADFEKRRIIGWTSSTKFIIDLNSEKPMLYDYNTSGFRFTSKTLVADDAAPLVIDKLGFIYQYSAGDRASVTTEIKINDTWKTESAFAVYPARDASGNGWVEIPLKNVFACRKFAMRITALTSSFYINAIKVHIKQGGIKGFASK